MADNHDSKGPLPARIGTGETWTPRLRAFALRIAEEPHGQTLTAPKAKIEEALRCLPSVRAEAEPATGEQRIAILFRLANVTGKPEVLRNGSASEQTQFWVVYHELLGHLPAAVLSRAAMEYLKSAPVGGGKWFPDPGTLLGLVKGDEQHRETMKALHGLERLAKARPEPDAADYVDLTEADISRRVREVIKRAADLDAADRAASDAEHQAAVDRLKAPEAPFDNSLLVDAERPVRKARAA